MEERRLKCILSHLTPRSPSLVGNTDILKGQSKSGAIEENWSSPIKVPDDLQWPTRRHAEELKAHRYTSESRASFDMYESRHLSLLKGTTMRGTTSHPIASSSSEEVVDVQFNRAAEIEPTDFLIASSGQVTGNSLSKELIGWCNSPCLELTLQRCRGLLRSRAPTFEVGGECPCISRNDEAYGGALWKTHIGGYNTDTTGFKTYKFNSGQLHCNRDAQLHHSCTPSDAAHLESDMGCKLHDQHEAQQTNECQADERANVKDDSKTIGTKRLNNLPGGIQDSQHEAVVSDHQAHTTTHEIFQSMVKQNLRSSRDMHRPDSQAVGIGSDVPGSMTVSRNNAMTGQRRPTVEDCIFCLIIQGRSPAFKLYEDEMCACILDVHPLSHGHSLIIPKAHFPSLELTPPEVAAAMCAIVPFISMAIMEATSCDSFNLLVNSGKAAGQVVFHTHFHIIPRRSGDNLWRSESACRRALALGRETSLLVQQIRHKLSEKRL